MSEKETGGPVILAVTGERIVCSAEDLGRLSADKWRIGSNGYVYRAGARVRGKQCLIHRIVMGAERGQEVHHLNGDKLDNRRVNLELTTASEHQDHHKHKLIERNKSNRIYPNVATCPICKKEYEPDPNHRGRQVACSVSCGVTFGKRRKRESERQHASNQ